MERQTGARNVIVGVSGSIAAYKAPSVIRLLRREGHEVRTVATEAALRFIGAPALAADPHSAAREALELADGGMRLKSAAGWTAQRTGLRPNEVYRAALALRETDPTAGGEHAVPEDSAESPAGDLGHDRHLR
mgnify:CR=1 FL=1